MPGQVLSQLIESITIDAYSAEEQLMGFLTVFGDEIALPCVANILDVDVEVLGFDVKEDERRGLVASCRRAGGRPGAVSFADVRFHSGTVAAWLHAAFRTWLGLETFPARRPAGWSWPEP